MVVKRRDRKSEGFEGGQTGNQSQRTDKEEKEGGIITLQPGYRFLSCYPNAISHQLARLQRKESAKGSLAHEFKKREWMSEISCFLSGICVHILLLSLLYVCFGRWRKKKNPAAQLN